MVADTYSSSHVQPAKPLTGLSKLWATRRVWLIGYLFILPWLIALVLFDIIPFVMNLYLSLTDYSVGSISSVNWVGLENYQQMSADPLFWRSLGNTAVYLVMSVPLTLLLALIIALLLNTEIRAVGAFRTLYYIPSVIPVVAGTIIFLWMLNTRFGIVNQLLLTVGLQPVRWLSNPDWIKPAMVLVSLWGFGAQMIIFLAALQDIPEQLYESVSIDGGGLWERLRFVTIPLMTPTILFNLLIGIINGFQVFTTAYIMLGPNGGPLQSGLFFMMHIYNNAFRYFDMGYSSALSFILFIIILIFTMLMMRSSNRWVYYGDEGEAS